MPGTTEFLQVIALAVDKSHTGIAIVRPDGVLAYANVAAVELLGLPGVDLSGVSVVDLAPWRDGSWKTRWARLRSEGTVRAERVSARGGEETLLETTDTFVRVLDGEYCVTVLRSERRARVDVCPSCGAPLRLPETES